MFSIIFCFIFLLIFCSVNSQKIFLSNDEYLKGKMNCSIQRWGEYRDFNFELSLDGKIYVNSFVYNYWCENNNTEGGNVENNITISIVGGNVTVCDKFTVLEENHIGCNYTSKYVSPLEINPNLIILGYRNVCYWDDMLNDWNCDSQEANRANVDCIKNTTNLMWNCVIKYYIKETFIRYYGPYNNFQIQRSQDSVSESSQNTPSQNTDSQNTSFPCSSSSMLFPFYTLLIFTVLILL